jgi:hypothetical protein
MSIQATSPEETRLTRRWIKVHRRVHQDDPGWLNNWMLMENFAGSVYTRRQVELLKLPADFSNATRRFMEQPTQWRKFEKQSLHPLNFSFPGFTI